MKNTDTYGFNGPERQERPYLITTNSRAFAGWADVRTFDGEGRNLWHVRALRNARLWGTANGVSELATKGPGCAGDCQLDDPSDATVVTDVRAIRPLSREAVKKWGI